MQITLINPPVDFNKTLGKAKAIAKYTAMPPLGLAYIASFLLSKRIEVNIIDAYAEGLSIKEIINKIPPKSTIGISVVTPTVPMAIKISQKAKEKKCKVIVGGPHICVRPNDVPCDYAIQGEGEIKLYEYLTGKKVTNNGTMPFPAYHLLPIEKYKAPPHWAIKNPVYFIFATRGCPFHCSFCAAELINNKRHLRDTDDVIAEIIYAMSEYGAKQIMFQDTCFPLEKQYSHELMSKIPKGVIWTTSTRVDVVDKETLELMYRSGCRIVNFGIESGNQKILDEVGKGFTLENVKKTMEIASRIGIKCFGSFILGLPNDTYQSCRETIDFAKSLPLHFAQFYMCVPYPGSRIFQGNTNWEQYSTMKSMTGDDPVYVPDNMTKEELVLLQKQAYKEFYSQPQLLWRHLKSMHLTDIPRYVEIGRILYA